MCMLAFVSVIVCCNESDRRIGILSKRKNRTEKNHTNHFRSAQMYLFIRFYSIFRPGHRRAASDRVTRDLISKRHEKKTSQTPHLSFLSPSLHLKWLRILIRHFWDEHFIFRWNFEKWINEFMDKKRANIKNSPIQFSVHRESARSRIQNHQVNGIFVFLFIALAELVFGFPRAHASRSTRRKLWIQSNKFVKYSWNFDSSGFPLRDSACGNVCQRQQRSDHNSTKREFH